MPKAPEEIELDQAWIGADELPVQFANAFVAIAGPNAYFVNLGSQLPPEISTEDDFERLKTRGYIPVKPIARIALSPQGLDDLIRVLETIRGDTDED
ncbi:MAG TPA: hypothetical protein VFN85_02010 [Solirubrobacterales bacterium]|nr:hypothetical protein [Solirubrobacterales bacterium]